MTKSLNDGEKRLMRKKLWDLPFDVVAYREDSETPYVLLVGPGFSRTPIASLTDVQAEELITRLQRALSVLPTSK
jgi:hypothetical protein